tara:strand:+ start:527 stop:694 length:168 start_codon:yes stop_codon:yes gene_type:complete
MARKKKKMSSSSSKPNVSSWGTSSKRKSPNVKVGRTAKGSRKKVVTKGRVRGRRY